MAVNDVTIFRDPDTGDVGLKDKSSGNKFLWSDQRQEWFLEDQSGERPVGGSKGAQNVSVTDYSVETKDGNRRLLVETTDEIRFSGTELDGEGNFDDGLYDFAFKPDNSKLVISDRDDAIYLYDTSDYSVIENNLTFTDLDSLATKLDYNSVGEIVVGSDLSSANEFVIFNESLDVVQTVTISGTDTSSIEVKFDPSEDRIGVGGTYFYIFERNSSTGNFEQVQTVNTPDRVLALDWNASTSEVALVQDPSNEVRIYDSNDYSFKTSFSTGSMGDFLDLGEDLAWRESDNHLAVGASGDGVVEVYDRDGGSYTLVETINVEPVGFSSLDFDDKGRLLIGSTDGNTYVYDSSFSQIGKFTESSGQVRAVYWGDPVTEEFVAADDTGIARVYRIVRNKVDIAADNPDYFETTIVNSGDWIVEIESTGATLNSLVGSQPKIVDQWGEATVRKTGSSEYLVEGDIYKETGDGFTQSL